jgi:uroporphyrinogen-III decarboxylase
MEDSTQKTKRRFIFDTQITTHAIRVAGVDATEMLNDAELFLDTQKEIFELYKLDKLCTLYDVYNIESAVLGQKIIYFKEDFPAVDTSDPIIRDSADLKMIKDIDYKGSPRSRFVLDLIDLYQEKVKPDFKPRFCAPFSLAVNIRGFENLITDIYSNKSFVKELFKRINYDLIAPWITLQRERVGDDSRTASGQDAWTAIPNVNLEIMEEVIIPSFRELQDLMGNLYLSMLGGARFLKDPNRFLDIQLAMNPVLVKGLDPDTEALGPEFFRDYADKKDIDLLLGVGPNILIDGSLDEIGKRIKRYIGVGVTVKNNFILYFNDIPADISPDKLKKIFALVKAYRNSICS